MIDFGCTVTTLYLKITMFNARSFKKGSPSLSRAFKQQNRHRINHRNMAKIPKRMRHGSTNQLYNKIHIKLCFTIDLEIIVEGD